VRRSKLRAVESKQTTIDDLTYAVLKYRMTGLDFVKGNKPTSLRYNFTQLDPQDPDRVFTFCLNVTQDDLYEVEDCSPRLNSTVVMELVDELNAALSPSDGISEFIRGMRRAFKQALSSYTHSC